MSGQSFDYFKDTILFEFKTDGILTVSGRTDLQWPYDGDYTYSIVEPDEQNDYRNLKIGASYFWTRVSSKELKIDASPLDGEVHKLIKYSL
jgi:hypothetical protein